MQKFFSLTKEKPSSSQIRTILETTYQIYSKGCYIRQVELQKECACVVMNFKFFRCHICYSVFNSIANASKHIREIHQRQNKFRCEQCEKRFNNLNNLTSHVYQVHSKISRYECPKCDDFQTHRKVTLFDHLRDAHLLPAEEIPKLIKSNYRLNNREAGTVHKCTLCLYSSKHKHEFKRHMTGKHGIDPMENELVCNLCKKEFLNIDTKSKHLCVVKLRIGERIDNLEWSSTCPDCNEYVFDKVSLNFATFF